jgi:molybdate transport system ATP-binding protein
VGGLALALTLRATVRKELGASFRLELDLTCGPGFHIVFGASGAGKTTLLNCIAGIASPDEGSIGVGERVLFDSSTRVDVPIHLRRVGYILQTQALFPHLSVRKNIAFGLKDAGDQRVEAIAEQMGLLTLLDRKPAQLSAGQRQRVALARTLVTDPQCLLMDEPLAALDAATKSDIVEVLRSWNRERQVPILYVTHDRDEAYSLGERLLVMQEGRIVAAGRPQEVLTSPVKNTVAQLAGFENLLECEVTGEHPEQGTMSCRIAGTDVVLEAPLTRVASQNLKLGIRAGDILLASERPNRISARNVLQGMIMALEQRGVLIRVLVNVGGAHFEAHVTPGAQVSLGLAEKEPVWLVIKTYSCHLLTS